MVYIEKILHFLFSVALFGFAALQFNDPDPIVWVSFYVICALVPVLLIFNKFYRPLFWCSLGICAVEIIVSAPGAYQYFLNMANEPLMQSMNAQKPYIEECREFLGALIAMTLVILSAVLARVKSRN